MQHCLDDIEDACDFVSSAAPCSNNAILSLETGRIYYLSDLGDSDEDLPDDVDDSPAYIAIPHRDDLDLGVRVVRDFVVEHAPALAEEVTRIFSRRGAYGRFKDLLREQSLLGRWTEYEAARTRVALREWCQAHEVELANDPPDVRRLRG